MAAAITFRGRWVNTNEIKHAQETDKQEQWDMMQNSYDGGVEIS